MIFLNCYQRTDIAIIGISLQFPQCNDIDSFWSILANGRDLIKEMPLERYERLNEYSRFDPNICLSVREKAAFLDRIDTFDNTFFGVPPNDAILMDPHQRKLLEVAWHTFEDAGVTEKQLANSNTGVFIGCASEPEYKTICKAYGYSDAPMTVLGNCIAILAGRISHYFNLKGPSMVINTVCSSSLVAVHQACNAILSHECGMALAGGVELRILPYRYAKIGIESSDARTHTFDEYSNGTGTGEGVATILLKPLDQAERDHDRIYAVIKGSAVNHDGQAVNISAPNPKAQTAVLKQAWGNAKINPQEISYIEAHGTGTKLGDPIEISAIDEAFQSYTDRKSFCAVSSVKSNLGHLDSAAGIAGLIKAVLSLYKQQFLPSVHFTCPNPNILFAQSAVYVNDICRDWDISQYHRICGVSSFGLSGTNCHIVLQDHTPSKDEAKSEMSAYYPFVVSAKTSEALDRLIGLYIEYLINHPDVDLYALSYTLSLHRNHYPHRFACISLTVDQLLECLRKRKSLPEINDDRIVADQHDPLGFESCKAYIHDYVKSGSPNWRSLYHVVCRPLCTISYPFETNQFWVSPKSRKSKNESKELRRVIIKAIEECLGYSNIDPIQSFYSLGGNSIHTIEIASQVYSATNREIDITRLLEAESVDEFCTYEELRKPLQFSPPTLSREMSTIQKRIFMQVRTSTNKKRSMNIHCMRFDRTLDFQVAEKTLSHIFEHIELFRTTFHVTSEGTTFSLHEKAVLCCHHFDITSLEQETINRVIQQIQFTNEPDRLPLIQFLFIETPCEKAIVTISHSIICDGTSIHNLMDLFLNNYGKQIDAQQIAQYSSFIPFLSREGDEYAKEMLPLLPSPSAIGKQQKPVMTNIVKAVLLTSDLQRLNTIASELRVSLLSVFITIIAIRRYWTDHNRDQFYAVILSGRSNAQLQHMIGPLSNLVPFYCQLDPHQAIGETIHIIDRILTQLRKYEHVTFEDIYKHSGINYLSSISDIINMTVMFEPKQMLGSKTIMIDNSQPENINRVNISISKQGVLLKSHNTADAGIFHDYAAGNSIFDGLLDHMGRSISQVIDE